MSGKRKQGKPGRPKGNPLSERERAQRRAAALKTGEYASTAIAQALPPCKPKVCPNGGEPCEVKKTIEARGGGLSSCLLALGEETTIRRFADAIVRGDTKGLAELASISLAAKSRLEQDGLHRLLTEGLVVDVPIVGKGPDGPEILDYRPTENPLAPIVLKLGEHLGRTASDQVATPKARGEKARDEGVGEMGRAAWIRTMQAALSGGGGEE